MATKKIYINPGHSNTDPGAVGYATERELNVKVSNYMKEYLTTNYTCSIKMNPGTIGSLSAISEDANAWGADLFVSNHFNAGGGDGFEALVYAENRIDLGNVFVKHVKAVGQNSRGVKLRPDLAVLRLTDMPAVLNEGAFVDNWNDIKDWNDNAELKKLGVAYAKAAAEYLGLPKKKASTTKATTTKSSSYLVKVTTDALNIRSGPGTNHGINGCIRDYGTYTIIQTSGNWGKLKSGAGWICLDYTKKV